MNRTPSDDDTDPYTDDEREQMERWYSRHPWYQRPVLMWLRFEA